MWYVPFDDGLLLACSPTAGHIFCTECVVKTVQAVQPIRNVHTCPMCRAPYNIGTSTLLSPPRRVLTFPLLAPLNPLVLPPHLRPFITPTIRRVYIDTPEQSKDSSTSVPPNVAEELARLRHENQTLKSHCTLWRRRAELHGSATLGLLDFARMVRDQAAALARERDDWARRCHSLKRKLDDIGPSLQCVSFAHLSSRSRADLHGFDYFLDHRHQALVQSPFQARLPFRFLRPATLKIRHTSTRHQPRIPSTLWKRLDSQSLPYATFTPATRPAPPIDHKRQWIWTSGLATHRTQRHLHRHRRLAQPPHTQLPPISLVSKLIWGSLRRREPGAIPPRLAACITHMLMAYQCLLVQQARMFLHSEC